MIARLCDLLQQNIVAHRLNRDQAQTAREGFILGHGNLLWGHHLRQPRRFLVFIDHDGLLNMLVDLVLGPIGGANKAIERCQLQEATDQANPTRANLDKHHMEAP